MIGDSNLKYENYLMERGWYIGGLTTLRPIVRRNILRTLTVMQDFVKDNNFEMYIIGVEMNNIAYISITEKQLDRPIKDYDWKDEHTVVRNIKNYFEFLGHYLYNDGLFVSDNPKGMLIRVCEQTPMILFMLPMVFKDKFSNLSENIVKALEKILKKAPTQNTLNELDELVKSSSYYSMMLDITANTLANEVGNKEIELLQQDINIVDREIQDNIDTYMGLLRRKKSHEIRLAGLKATNNIEIFKDLFDFFRNNQSCTLGKIKNTEVSFTVKTELSTWKESYLDSVNKQRKEGKVMPFVRGVAMVAGLTREDGEFLFDKIFNERKIKVKTYATYYINFGYTDIGQIYGVDDCLGDYLLSPHVKYRCIGEPLRSAVNFLKNNQYIECVSQLIDTTASVNLLDGTVMGWLGKIILDTNCLEYEGKIYNGLGLIRQLREEKENDD